MTCEQVSGGRGGAGLGSGCKCYQFSVAKGSDGGSMFGKRGFLPLLGQDSFCWEERLWGTGGTSWRRSHGKVSEGPRADGEERDAGQVRAEDRERGMGRADCLSPREELVISVDKPPLLKARHGQEWRQLGL